jgi:uncharacterized membrane protein (DUF485 family)
VACGIGDKVGKERMPIVALSALTVGSVIAAPANSSGPMIATRGAAAIVAVIWVAIEQRSEPPLIDMRKMRLPAAWISNLVALLVGFGIYAFIGFAPQFTQTPTSAGYGFGAPITMAPVAAYATVAVVAVLIPRTPRRGIEERFIAEAGVGVIAG